MILEEEKRSDLRKTRSIAT